MLAIAQRGAQSAVYSGCLVNIHIHIYHHGASADPSLLAAINELKGLIMTTAAEFNAGFARIDAATTAIGQLIRDIVASQQAGSMTAEEEEAAQTKLLACATALEAMATNPTEPVPVAVPT